MNEELIGKANDLLKSLNIESIKGKIEDTIRLFSMNGKRHFNQGVRSYDIPKYGKFQPGGIITEPKIIEGKIKFLLVTRALGLVEIKVQIHIPAKTKVMAIIILTKDFICFFLDISEIKFRPKAAKTAKLKSMTPINLEGLEPEITGIPRSINSLLSGVSTAKIIADIIKMIKNLVFLKTRKIPVIAKNNDDIPIYPPIST